MIKTPTLLTVLVFAVTTTFCTSTQADQKQEEWKQTADQASKGQAIAEENQQKHDKAAKQHKKAQQKEMKANYKQQKADKKHAEGTTKSKVSSKDKAADMRKNSTPSKNYRSEDGAKSIATQRDTTQQKKPWWKFWQRSNTE